MKKQPKLSIKFCGHIIFNFLCSLSLSFHRLVWTFSPYLHNGSFYYYCCCWHWQEIDVQPTTKNKLICKFSICLTRLHHGGGQVVSTIAFYTDDPSWDPAKVSNFLWNCCWKERKWIKRNCFICLRSRSKRSQWRCRCCCGKSVCP